MSGSDAALSQGRALAQNAIEQLGREEAEARAATQCNPSTPSQAGPVAAVQGRRSNAGRGRRGRRGRGKDTAARGTLQPGHGGGARQACARADPATDPAPRSRNVVLITVESMGALYTLTPTPTPTLTPTLTPALTPTLTLTPTSTPTLAPPPNPALAPTLTLTLTLTLALTA